MLLIRCSRRINCVKCSRATRAENARGKFLSLSELPTVLRRHSSFIVGNHLLSRVTVSRRQTRCVARHTRPSTRIHAIMLAAFGKSRPFPFRQQRKSIVLKGDECKKRAPSLPTMSEFSRSALFFGVLKFLSLLSSTTASCLYFLAVYLDFASFCIRRKCAISLLKYGKSGVAKKEAFSLVSRSSSLFSHLSLSPNLFLAKFYAIFERACVFCTPVFYTHRIL